MSFSYNKNNLTIYTELFVNLRSKN